MDLIVCPCQRCRFFVDQAVSYIAAPVQFLLKSDQPRCSFIVLLFCSEKNLPNAVAGDLFSLFEVVGDSG